MLMYRREDIEQVLNLLNVLDTRGIDNCRRIAVIDQILRGNAQEGKEDTDGNHGTGVGPDA